MAGKNPKQPQHAKVCKPIGLRLRDCESHLRHLKEDLIAYANKDRDRYKTIAGHLRVLVCKFGRNKPRLLDLMDHSEPSRLTVLTIPHVEGIPEILVFYCVRCKHAETKVQERAA